MQSVSQSLLDNEFKFKRNADLRAQKAHRIQSESNSFVRKRSRKWRHQVETSFTPICNTRSTKCIVTMLQPGSELECKSWTNPVPIFIAQKLSSNREARVSETICTHPFKRWRHLLIQIHLAILLTSINFLLLGHDNSRFHKSAYACS